MDENSVICQSRIRMQRQQTILSADDEYGYYSDGSQKNGSGENNGAYQQNYNQIII